MELKDRIIAYIQTIPIGQVVSYGRVASACGKPNHARQVGRILSTLDIFKIKIPWWRVVNAKGEISLKGHGYINKQAQADLLKQDGVKVMNFKVDKKYFL